jgi:hypothetical protein
MHLLINTALIYKYTSPEFVKGTSSSPSKFVKGTSSSLLSSDSSPSPESFRNCELKSSSSPSGSGPRAFSYIIFCTMSSCSSSRMKGASIAQCHYKNLLSNLNNKQIKNLLSNLNNKQIKNLLSNLKIYLAPCLLAS